MALTLNVGETIVRRFIDPVNNQIMTDAVILTRCGHTLSQRTAEACRRQSLPCPIGEPHPCGDYVPDLATREIIHLLRIGQSIAAAQTTLRGRIASLPLYQGDIGIRPAFIPCAEKTGGTCLGTIFEYAEGLQTSRWIGKVGLPTGLLRNDPATIRKRTRMDMNLDTIREKIACDFYTILGFGFFETPRTCLSLQNVMDSFNTGHALAQGLLAQDIRQTLRIMSRLVEGYQDFAHIFTLHQGQRITVPAFIEILHRPPEEILTPEGEIVPLTGLVELFAVSRAIGDTDVFGGSGTNAGIIWIRNDRGVITSGRTIKIDPGLAFQVFVQEGDEVSQNIAYNTIHRLGREERWQQDNRNLQLANNNHAIAVHWTSLTMNQQRAFIHAMNSCLTTLANQEDLYFLLYRDGAFRRSDEEQISQTIAELYVTHMQGWLEHQQAAWQQELTQYREAQPAEVFRREMDARIAEQDRRSLELTAIIEQQEARTRAIQEGQQNYMREVTARIVELERRERELMAHETAGPPHVVRGPEAVSPVRLPVPLIPEMAFGAAKWAAYFGDVGVEPQLPPNIGEILAEPCPFDPTKTVEATHLLVLVPASVNGLPLTLDSLGEMIKDPRQGGHHTQYRAYNDYIQREYGAIPCGESHWVLMTRDVLPGTRSRSYADQQIILAGFRFRQGAYQVPTLLEAAVAILMEHAVTGTRLYSDAPKTYTRCQEAYNAKWQMVFGGFAAAGPGVSYSRNCVCDGCGLGGVRKC